MLARFIQNCILPLSIVFILTVMIMMASIFEKDIQTKNVINEQALIQAIHLPNSQRIVIIQSHRFGYWLQNHTKIEITSITSSDVDPNGINPDGKYLIVLYKDLNPETKFDNFGE